MPDFNKGAVHEQPSPETKVQFPFIAYHKLVRLDAAFLSCYLLANESGMWVL
jgi:hypothetical protein